MKYYIFHPQFYQPILDLTKIGTIRDKQKVRPGERFALRYWSLKPYRSKMKTLGTAVCAEVSVVEIKFWKHLPGAAEILLANKPLHDEDLLEKFTKAEGFRDFKHMREWFLANNKMPIKAVWTRWDPQTFIPNEDLNLRSTRSRSGFTAIEALLVLGIIGIIAAMMVARWLPDRAADGRPIETQNAVLESRLWLHGNLAWIYRLPSGERILIRSGNLCLLPPIPIEITHD